MYKYEDIEYVHLELTERCQASCPMCPRTNNPLITNAELSLNDIKKIFSIDFIKKLKGIKLCGNYGDPLAAKDCLDIIKYFKKHNSNICFGIGTNGGLRNSTWWKDLAETINDNGSHVAFGIDGLQNTNHLYRIGVDWKILMNSVKTFIENGGKARWDYLVFSHNDHQIEEAKQMSIDMGFVDFNLKRTNRITSRYKGKLKQSEKYSHDIVKKIENLNLDLINISCKAKNKKEIYISAEGLLFPCCWVGNGINISFKNREQIWDLVVNKDLINTKILGIEYVMNCGFLDEIENSWNKKSILSGKLKTCALMCNIEHDLHRSQFL